jgi:hypothetical protein
MPAIYNPRRALLKRRLFWISILLALLALAVVLLVSADGPVGRGSYNRIKEGMSREEVLAIIGLPPGNHSTDFYTSVSVERTSESREGEIVWWVSNTGMIEVGLDDQEKVRWKSFRRLETQNSTRAKLRSWWESVRKFI